MRGQRYENGYQDEPVQMPSQIAHMLAQLLSLCALKQCRLFVNRGHCYMVKDCEQLSSNKKHYLPLAEECLIANLDDATHLLELIPIPSI